MCPVIAYPCIRPCVESVFNTSSASVPCKMSFFAFAIRDTKVAMCPGKNTLVMQEKVTGLFKNPDGRCSPPSLKVDSRSQSQINRKATTSDSTPAIHFYGNAVLRPLRNGIGKYWVVSV